MKKKRICIWQISKSVFVPFQGIHFFNKHKSFNHFRIYSMFSSLFREFISLMHFDKTILFSSLWFSSLFREFISLINEKNLYNLIYYLFSSLFREFISLIEVSEKLKKEDDKKFSSLFREFISLILSSEPQCLCDSKHYSAEQI